MPDIIQQRPSEAALIRIGRYVEKYREKSGTTGHPDPDVTEGVVFGLAANVDEARATAAKYGIQAIPAFVVIQDGEVKVNNPSIWSGLMPASSMAL